MFSKFGELPETNISPPWKWIVGRRSVPFRARPIFRGYDSFREGISSSKGPSWSAVQIKLTECKIDCPICQQTGHNSIKHIHKNGYKPWYRTLPQNHLCRHESSRFTAPPQTNRLPIRISFFKIVFVGARAPYIWTNPFVGLYLEMCYAPSQASVERCFRRKFPILQVCPKQSVGEREPCVYIMKSTHSMYIKHSIRAYKNCIYYMLLYYIFLYMILHYIKLYYTLYIHLPSYLLPTKCRQPTVNGLC